MNLHNHYKIGNVVINHILNNSKGVVKKVYKRSLTIQLEGGTVKYSDIVSEQQFIKDIEVMPYLTP